MRPARECVWGGMMGKKKQQQWQECRAGAAYTGSRPSGDERASLLSVGVGLTSRHANGSVPCMLFPLCRLILCLNQPFG